MQHQGTLSLRGTLAVKHIRATHIGWGYRLRNLPNILRGYWKHQLATTLGISHFYGQLSLRLITADGRVIDYGVISTRVVTTAFVNALASNMVAATTPAIDAFDYHALGIGTTAEAVGDTTLVNVTGCPARVAGTPTNPSANVYQTVATTAFTSALAITEHGVFSASTVGTLLDRSVFAAINTANGDSIQTTYQLTNSAGG